MKFNKKYAILATTASLTLLLAACGGGNSGANDPATEEVTDENGNDQASTGDRDYTLGYPDHVINEGDPLKVAKSVLVL